MVLWHGHENIGKHHFANFTPSRQLGILCISFSPLEGILETSNRHGLQWSQGCPVFEAPGIVFLDTWQQIWTAVVSSKEDSFLKNQPLAQAYIIRSSLYHTCDHYVDLQLSACENHLIVGATRLEFRQSGQKTTYSLISRLGCLRNTTFARWESTYTPEI